MLTRSGNLKKRKKVRCFEEKQRTGTRVIGSSGVARNELMALGATQDSKSYYWINHN